jgi:hypothetical protein
LFMQACKANKLFTLQISGRQRFRNFTVSIVVRKIKLFHKTPTFLRFLRMRNSITLVTTQKEDTELYFSAGN